MKLNMEMEEDILEHYLVDLENCKDIDELQECDFPKKPICKELIICAEFWSKLIDLNFEDGPLKNYFDDLSEDHRRQYFTFGVACMINFVQANFTGPKLPGFMEDFFVTSMFRDIDFSKMLALNNEEINNNTKIPALLVAAKVIFKNCHFNTLLNNWWSWRTFLIHQQILEDLSPSLLYETDKLYKELENANLKGNMKAKLEIEIAQLYMVYRNVNKVKNHVENACKILGLKYELIGRLGRRTKFQAKDIAQLALEVTLIEKENIQRPPVRDIDVPKNLVLEDQVRFDALKYAENLNHNTLFPNTEQKLLLCVAQEMIMSMPPDELYLEELQPFYELILSQANTWCVRTVTLLLRCLLESHHKRTRERSLMQCEDVLKSIEKETPHPFNRIGGVFSTGLRPVWKTEFELGTFMLKLGLVKNSLDVFIKLGAWDDVVGCYILLKMNHKAAEIIKQVLEVKPTVRLWCLLGDATNDVSCYEKAWELSKRRSSRAQRHWGQYLYTRKQYQQCIPHFEKSVSINPLQAWVWLSLGFAALETENWQVAATAYRRYTSLEPGNFEAWNNLAKAYIKLGNKRSAHQALHDALRCYFENWKVWDNLMIVSADIGHFSDVIQAYHRILDYKEKHLDVEVLSALVYGVVNNVNDSEGRPSGRLLPKVRELLGRVTAIYPKEGQLWVLYATVAPALTLKAQRLQKAYKNFTQTGWDRNQDMCQQVLYTCQKLAEIALNKEIVASDPLVNSIRLNLSSAIAVICKKEDSDNEIQSLFANVSILLAKVMEKAKSASIKIENKEG
ncbi:tetratricopeptide repeat protein 27 [Agrilus planipennis]|uniref:Tetratricopeptide repeat protein 27 n=1 Tax=Agrilus planipennis TaxID=224129 RepID=A0A1W4XJ31_AGRPL|nr:tetratricopeptide repeat protein 27 [Agrilus planipennis]